VRLSRLISSALRIASRSIVVGGTLLAACGTDNTGPTPSLVGTWDLVGFTDMGIAAATTGTWIFRSDGTLSVDGTITFPGEPTEALIADGTYVQSGSSVTLTIGTQSGRWTMVESGNDLTLTEDEPPPANTIVLRRQP
jgi:hypothetical protein